MYTISNVLACVLFFLNTGNLADNLTVSVVGSYFMAFPVLLLRIAPTLMVARLAVKSTGADATLEEPANGSVTHPLADVLDNHIVGH
ncbi:hypothetical protein D9613_007347 [Agrocybe pediades]|uniref:Uncharacterized protein n=1 Tax=Agrocybe pediades TaxID=84607 RepID=A0A8H4QIV4_9AGAR|nr:hypothetical protein D9613_007347 [Agrocybe pediades]